MPRAPGKSNRFDFVVVVLFCTASPSRSTVLQSVEAAIGYSLATKFLAAPILLSPYDAAADWIRQPCCRNLPVERLSGDVRLRN